MPAGTDLIYIHLDDTVLLANWIQNIVQIPKFEKPEVLYDFGELWLRGIFLQALGPRD